MNNEKNWLPNSSRQCRPPRWPVRKFGGLRVRYKLIVLHNLFFFVLATAVYLSVIPIFSEHVDNAMHRELGLMANLLDEWPQGANTAPQETELYDTRTGTAQNLGLSPEGQQFLKTNPGGIWQQGESVLFHNDGPAGQYRRLAVHSEYYARVLRQARTGLFVVLGCIYVLSIVVMEFIIMPQFVYQPLRLMLQADEATQRDDREHELIDDRFILNDEIGQIMHSRNVTIAQLRKQEDDLADALQRLEEQDRLVSLGMLSTSVAHELNTPLAVLQGSIEKLLERTADAQTTDRLSRMLRVTQRLRKISEGLVDFARVRKEERGHVPLRPIIDESWNLVAIDEKAGVVNFSNNVPEEHAVAGNPDRLVQVFVNLARNALMAVPPGGSICVRSRRLQKNGHDWIACTVEDDGPGIPSDVLPNLFEAFVTTRLDARGTGLGLTVAEGIITQHGGMISAANRPDGGAALEVMLPAAV